MTTQVMNEQDSLYKRGYAVNEPGGGPPLGEGEGTLCKYEYSDRVATSTNSANSSAEMKQRGGREKGLEATRRDKVSFITTDLSLTLTWTYPNPITLALTKVSFITGDLELDPSTPWPKVLDAAEAIGLSVGSGGNLGSKIDRLYKQLAR